MGERGTALACKMQPAALRTAQGSLWARLISDKHLGLCAGCYVPCDPAYPDDRLQVYMEDGGAAVLVLQQHHADRAQTLGGAAATWQVRLAGTPAPVLVSRTGDTKLPCLCARAPLMQPCGDGLLQNLVIEDLWLESEALPCTAPPEVSTANDLCYVEFTSACRHSAMSRSQHACAAPPSTCAGESLFLSLQAVARGGPRV